MIYGYLTTGCLQKSENQILLPFTTFHYLSSMKFYYLLTAFYTLGNLKSVK